MNFFSELATKNQIRKHEKEIAELEKNKEGDSSARIGRLQNEIRSLESNLNKYKGELASAAQDVTGLRNSANREAPAQGS